MPRRPPPSTPGTKLFVGNMRPGITDTELASIASSYGEVEEAIVLERLSARGQRCGFIRFIDPFAAKMAKAALEGTTFMGTSPLMVRHADKPVRRSSATSGDKTEERNGVSPTRSQFTPLRVADPFSPLGLTALTPREKYDSVYESGSEHGASLIETSGSSGSSDEFDSGDSNDSGSFYRHDPYSFKGLILTSPLP